MQTSEDREIEAKLRDLKKDFDRNEEQMRKAAVDYEGLVAKKEDLAAAIAELKKARGEMRSQAGKSRS